MGVVQSDPLGPAAGDGARLRPGRWLIGLVGAAALSVGLGGLLSRLLDVTPRNGSGWGDRFWDAAVALVGRADLDEGDWPARSLSMALSVVGLLLAGALVAVLVAWMIGSRESGAIEGAIDEEPPSADHVVLGAGPYLAPLVERLVAGSSGGDDTTVLVASTEDAERIQDHLGHRLGERAGLARVIDAGADPMRAFPEDALRAAQSIVVLGDDDAHVASQAAVLAQHGAGRRVIAAVASPQVVTALGPAQSGPTVISTDDVIAGLLLRAVVAPGAGDLLTDLVGEGGEGLVTEYVVWSKEPLRQRPDASRRGPVLAVAERSGETVLFPGDEARTASGGAVVSVADRQASRPWSEAATDPSAATRVAIVGWNAAGPALVAALVTRLGPGSTIRVIVGSGPTGAPLPTPRSAGVRLALVDRPEGHDDFARLVGSATDVVVQLADTEGPAGDARTWLDLAALDRARRDGWLGEGTRLISQFHQKPMMGHESGEHDRLVVTEDSVASVLALVVDRPELAGVLAALLAPTGAELVAVPTRDSGEDPDGTVDFGDLAQQVTAEGGRAVGVLVGDRAHFAPARSTAWPASQTRTLTLGPPRPAVATEMSAPARPAEEAAAAAESPGTAAAAAESAGDTQVVGEADEADEADEPAVIEPELPAVSAEPLPAEPAVVMAPTAFIDEPPTEEVLVTTVQAPAPVSSPAQERTNVEALRPLVPAMSSTAPTAAGDQPAPKPDAPVAPWSIDPAAVGRSRKQRPVIDHPWAENWPSWPSL